MKIPYFSVLLSLVLLVSSGLPSANGACDVSTLTPCGRAFYYSQPPTATCCSRLQDQKPCYCQYLKDPRYSGFINSRKGKSILDACKVSIPKC
ncbi:hypothetical protein AMTRI_Chr12g235180 [Amborella trichopoda]|uniref:Bifunctional inhibitor/plant lipid transfer protein/seed storage helical domain-containing protein n=1 Tax=Amborella trichopoda TaxID=13333 RepID=U5D486_AMBTC|nr:hypothetical protein AMTR_s00044p00213670 [Amborella trichopoda]